MNHIKQELLQLLDKYTLDLCSDEERAKLSEYISSGRYDDILHKHVKQMLDDSALEEEQEGMNEQRAAAIMEKILNYGPKVQNTQQQTISIFPKRKNIIKRWSIAASIILVFALAICFFANKNIGEQSIYGSILHLKNVKSVTNTTHSTLTLNLEDGSKVTLQPKAVLAFPEDFLGNKERKVYLEGDAFFDIEKDPKHPFLVFHKNLITKVLGTKFFIKQSTNNNQTEVEVRSGKVEVFENDKLVNKKVAGINDGAIITPNQKVIYIEDKRIFSTTLVDTPLPTVEKDADGNVLKYDNRLFDFKSATLKQIVPIIEKYYGVKLEVENDALNNCLFTGDISTENLYTKLDILCSTMGSSYEVKGINILIKGSGCEK